MQVTVTHTSTFGLLSRLLFAVNAILVTGWSGLVLYGDPFHGQSWMLTYCGGITVCSLVVLLVVPLSVLGEYPLSWEGKDQLWRCHVRRLLRATFIFVLFLDPYMAYPALRWCAPIARLPPPCNSCR